MYNQDVEYEWDEAKRQENLAKHHVDFASIEGFDWNTADIIPSPRYAEPRQGALGYIDGALHYVVFVDRGAKRRIISLRPPSRRERSLYGKAT